MTQGNSSLIFLTGSMRTWTESSRSLTWKPRNTMGGKTRLWPRSSGTISFSEINRKLWTSCMGSTDPCSTVPSALIGPYNSTPSWCVPCLSSTTQPKGSRSPTLKTTSRPKKCRSLSKNPGIGPWTKSMEKSWRDLTRRMAVYSFTSPPTLLATWLSHLDQSMKFAPNTNTGTSTPENLKRDKT